MANAPDVDPEKKPRGRPKGTSSPPITNDDTQLTFEELDPGELLNITRLAPVHNGMAGFLATIPVPPEGAAALPEILAENWGGGTYQIKRKRRCQDGKIRFAKGSAIYQISGEPKQTKQLVTVQQDPTPLALGQLVDAVGRLLNDRQPIANVTSSQPQLGANLDIVGVIDKLAGVLRGVQQPQRTTSPLGELESMIGIWERMSKVFTPKTAPTPSPIVEDEDDNGLGRILKLAGPVLERYLGAHAGMPPMNMGQNAPTVQNASVQQNPINSTMPPPPSANHVWHPHRGWHLPPISVVPNPDNDTDDEDYAPIEPEDVVERLGELNDVQKNDFMMRIFSAMGVDINSLPVPAPKPHTDSGSGN